MAANDDNATKQADEVEALSAIYEGLWKAEDQTSHKYSIQVQSDTLTTDAGTCNPKIVDLQIEMPPDYPSHSPPFYQLSAPWLGRDDKAQLETSLQDIYCENLGESIIYLWVEKIREFLSGRPPDQQVAEDTEDVGDIMESLGELQMCMMQETDTLYNCPEIHHGEPFTDRKSKFIAHLAQAIHPSQVQMVLDKLKEDRKIAAATHNILAYRISQGENPNLFYMGCDDDGETKAGSRLLHLLQTVDARDVVVVVTRWYGGIHLGPDRFKHISGLARIILETCGYIKDKTSKKGVRSSNKKGR